jgi:hypothetical protein
MHQLLWNTPWRKAGRWVRGYLIRSETCSLLWQTAPTGSGIIYEIADAVAITKPNDWGASV